MLRIPLVQAAIDAIYFTCPERRLFTSLVRPLVDPRRGHYSCSVIISSTCSEKRKGVDYRSSSFVSAIEKSSLLLCPFENSTFVKRGKKTMPLSPPLTADQRETLLKPLLAEKGWKMDESGRDAIKKEFVFKDFIQAWSFMSMVAIKAEKLNHHPEWSNVYNRVSILFSSHDVNGLSERDIKMAKFSDGAFDSIKQ